MKKFGRKYNLIKLEHLKEIFLSPEYPGFGCPNFRNLITTTLISNYFYFFFDNSKYSFLIYVNQKYQRCGPFIRKNMLVKCAKLLQDLITCHFYLKHSALCLLLFSNICLLLYPLTFPNRFRKNFNVLFLSKYFFTELYS